jgi:thiamine monophosphate synthase
MINSFKKINIPDQWFFCNPLETENYKIVKKLNKKTGIVFFNNNLRENGDFIKNIKPFIHLCQKNRIMFLIQSSLYWANKFKAIGILIDLNNNPKINMVNLRTIKRKFLLATKIHNHLEALNCRDWINISFISNIYNTSSHPKRRSLNIYEVLMLSKILKSKINFGLGGLTKKKFHRVKNKWLYGFGAISYFKK